MARDFLTKAELISQVAKRAGIKKVEAERAVNAFIETIKDNLGKGKGVRIIGFGAFLVKQRKPRKSRNPRTGESLTIPATKVPAFKPSADLKALISGKKK